MFDKNSKFKGRKVNKDGKVGTEKWIRNEQDPFFYAEDENAIKDMASIPFLETTGYPIANIKGVTPTVENDVTYDQLPGCMVMHYIPSFGNTVGGLDLDTSMTRQANALFNNIAQGYSASVPFEAPDIFMLEVSAASLASGLMLGKRIYGLMHQFAQMNGYYAKALVSSLGFNYEDLSKNLAEFRTSFNIRVAQFNESVAVPQDFAILKRWGLINSSIFNDTASPEYSTSYAWTPDALLIYDATSALTGTCLRYDYSISGNSVPRQRLTVDEYFAAMDKLFQAMNDSDGRSMFGSIRKVYSDGELLKLTQLDDSYRTPFFNNDIIKMQVHNANWFGNNLPSTLNWTGEVIGYMPKSLSTSGRQLKDVAVYQTSRGDICSEPMLTFEDADNFAFINNPDIEDITKEIIDMYDHMVTPGNILDATATKSPTYGNIKPITLNDGTVAQARDIYPRCEIIIDIDMSILNTDAASGITSIPVQPAMFSSGSQELLAAQFEEISLLTHLDSHPLIPVYSDATMEGGVSVYALTRRIGEIDKYTVVDKEFLAKLNNRCSWKLFMLPKNSKSITK